MKFEEKISGTKVTDFNIKPLFDSQFISLQDVIDKDLSQRTMNWILDTLRFHRGERNEENKDVCIWWGTIDFDTNYKLAVLENYPEYEKEFVKYFGENWMNHYIRFNHQTFRKGGFTSCPPSRPADLSAFCTKGLNIFRQNYHLTFS